MKKYSFAILAFFAVGLLLIQAPLAAEINGVNIHGFVSQGYLQTTNGVEFLVPETDEGTAEFSEIGLNFSTQLSGLSENLSIGAQLLAFDFGYLGNNEVEIDWAYGDYAFADELGVRAGIMKTPHGLYNETRKIDALRPSIFLPTSVYPETMREAMSRTEGAGIYGTLFDSLSYQFMAGHNRISDDGGVAQMFNNEFGGLGLAVTDIDTDETYSAALVWDTPLDGLKFSATMLHTKMGLTTMGGATPFPVPQPVVDPVDPLNLVGISWAPLALEANIDWEPTETAVASVEYQRDRLTLAAEYIEYDYEFSIDVNAFGNPAYDTTLLKQMAAADPVNLGYLSSVAYAIDTVTVRKATQVGYYGQVAYRILDDLEIGTYYSVMYADKDDRNGSDLVAFGQPRTAAWLKDSCLSARYDINSNWCAKLEGHYMDGTYLTVNNTGDARYWELYCAKLSYMF